MGDYFFCSYDRLVTFGAVCTQTLSLQSFTLPHTSHNDGF